jgi:hypothetical protein
MIVPKPADDNLTISEDDCKKVIEVVRNPTGQASDNLHSLRLSQLLAEFTLLGDFL